MMIKTLSNTKCRTTHARFTEVFLIIGLIFAIYLYAYLEATVSVFSYTDEAMAVSLFAYYALNNHRKLKEFSVFICIMTFYVLYSLLLGITNINAIAMDLIIQVKPFLIYYCSVAMGLQLSQRGKRTVRHLINLLVFITFSLTIVNYDFVMVDIFGHSSRFGTFITIAGFLYYYCSDRSHRALRNTLIIWACMLFCMKVKSIGFFVLALFVILYFSNLRTKIKFNIKTLVWFALGVAVMMFFAWDRFAQFFITNGYSAGTIEDMYARPALYVAAFEIIKDYFPFGSGFGTFASWASGVYYSPIYYMYDLYNVYGLQPDKYSFVSDTYFPVLAQFGCVGVILFICFMWRRAKSIWTLYKNGLPKEMMLMMFLILLFFIIESTTDSTLIQNRGVVMMLVFALYFNESCNKIKCKLF